MKVLVTAASRHGSTTEMAEVIAGTLRGAGLGADVVAPDEVTSLALYDAVVLGSAIYMGKWLEPAKAFVERFGGELAEMPVWAFSSGPVGDPPKPGGTPPDVTAVLEHTSVREHQVFAGELDRSELGFAEKVITRAVGAAEGDFRAWPEIEAWATGIAETLKTKLGWRHEGAAEREEKLQEFWHREMEAKEPVG